MKPNSDQTPVWNEKIAMARLGDDDELLKSMMQYFFEDAPDLQTQLREALASENALEATRLAHSLKGLCVNFEALAASAAAEHVEVACRNGKLADASKLFAQLDTEVETLTTALKTRFQS